MIRVDAHHHIWRLDRGGYDWIRPGTPLHRDYGLEDLRPHLTSIDATILVQAAANEAETAWLLEAARQSDGLVRGVVGWTDLAAPDAASRVTGLAKDGLLKGLRPMLQDIEDTYWILRDEVKPGLRAMAEAGLGFDALIEPRHLPLIPILAALHPALRIVIDHAAKPPIASKAPQPWSDDLARAAGPANVFCKLSGLPTQANAVWMMNELRPWCDHVLDHFGPSRTMWGSDWPVVEAAGGYRRWHGTFERFLFRFGLPDRAEVMGGTAARFYGLAGS